MTTDEDFEAAAWHRPNHYPVEKCGGCAALSRIKEDLASARAERDAAQQYAQGVASENHTLRSALTPEEE